MAGKKKKKGKGGPRLKIEVPKTRAKRGAGVVIEEPEAQGVGMEIEDVVPRGQKDENFANAAWGVIEQTISRLFAQNGSMQGIGFQRIHRLAYEMVLYKFGKKLYSGMTAAVTLHVKEVAELLNAAQGDVLEELSKKWDSYKLVLLIMQRLFWEVDVTYVPSSCETCLRDFGLSIWNEHIIHSKEIRSRVLAAVFDLIDKERKGEVSNGDHARNIIQMLIDFGSYVYEEYFEKPFLEDLARFYSAKCQDYWGVYDCREFMEIVETQEHSYDCGKYLDTVERELGEERKRALYWFHDSTLVKVSNIIKKETVVKPMSKMAYIGIRKMLMENTYEDLRRIYTLFLRVPDALSTVKNMMDSNIRETGLELISDPDIREDPAEFIQRLLRVKDAIDDALRIGFQNDSAFKVAFLASFKYFANLYPGTPEFLSFFIDKVLRNEDNFLGEEAVDMALHLAVRLVVYLDDKDLFEIHYQKQLARRLVFRNFSRDAEMNMIQRLRAECGPLLASKLGVMLADVITSEDMVQDFETTHTLDATGGLKLDVQVLRNGCWPMRATGSCILPAEALKACQKFGEFFNGLAVEKRKLSWVTNMGTADIIMTFGDGRKHKLIVSTYQMCILMLFNTAECLSYKEIMVGTEIPEAELRRSLKALAIIRDRNVLTKKPMSKDIGEEDTFCFNEKFTSNRYTITFVKVADLETEEVRERLESERGPQIQAALVRIMKYRRVWDHKRLVTDVILQLQDRFIPKHPAIKKCIESLIEREYLKRDEEDAELYHFVDG